MSDCQIIGTAHLDQVDQIAALRVDECGSRPRGTPYGEWLGTADDSASVLLDANGQELRRNLARDPSFEHGSGTVTTLWTNYATTPIPDRLLSGASDTDVGWRYYETGSGDFSLHVDPVIGPFVRKTATANTPAASRVPLTSRHYHSGNVAVGRVMPIEGDETVTVSYWMRITGTSSAVRCYFYYIDSSNSKISDTSAVINIEPDGEWHRAVFSDVAPSGAAGVGISIYSSSTTIGSMYDYGPVLVLRESSTLDLSNIPIFSGNGPATSREDDLNWFGDDFTYGWAGAPNDSESEIYAEVLSSALRVWALKSSQNTSTGKYSLRLIGSSTNHDGYSYPVRLSSSQAISDYGFLEGRDYTISVDVFTPLDFPLEGRSNQIRIYGGVGTKGFWASSPQGTPGQTDRVSVTITIPQGVDHLEIRLYNRADGDAYGVWFDDLLIEEATEPMSYFDGNT